MPKSKKLRVGVLFGGRSGEHEISLLSAASILQALDPEKYDIVPIGITKAGRWLTADNAHALLAGTNAPPAQLVTGDLAATSASPVPRAGKKPATPTQPDINPLTLAASADAAGSQSLALDVVFPVLHGTFGEDGTIQGLFELADIAYVGSGVLGSAAGMDKVVMKQLFAAAGLPQTPWVPCLRTDWIADAKRVTKRIEKHLRYPVFVKPANLGSSVGISKVHDCTELTAAMNLACTFDRKLIIEEGVGGPGVKPRELEVAILGNIAPAASVVGEIIPAEEFYSYNAKYHSDASVPVIPADLPKHLAKRIRKLAVAAFEACDAAGLARVDFLLEPASKHHKPRLLLNEINTLPGFTAISMYPKLWEATGLPYRELIDRLITLALERHTEKKQTSFTHA